MLMQYTEKNPASRVIDGPKYNDMSLHAMVLLYRVPKLPDLTSIQVLRIVNTEGGQITGDYISNSFPNYIEIGVKHTAIALVPQILDKRFCFNDVGRKEIEITPGVYHIKEASLPILKLQYELVSYIGRNISHLKVSILSEANFNDLRIVNYQTLMASATAPTIEALPNMSYQM